VWWNIATIQKQLNDRDAALSALEQAVTLAPQHQQIAADLARYRADNS
jgi:cytochrome c-type biogenesis protein CcmH/NrfG